MIYIGDNEISSVYLGDSDMSAIYIGENQIYPIGYFLRYTSYSETVINVPVSGWGTGVSILSNTYTSGKGGTIEFSAAPTQIADSAFTNSDITDIKLSNNITAIGDYAFAGCSHFTEIDFKKVTSVGDYAFADSDLVTVAVPSTIAIGDGVFSGCTALAIASIDGDVPDYTFKGCTSLLGFDIKGDVGQEAFSGCTMISSFNIGGCSSIGDYAFADCSSLEEINANDETAPTLGNFVFYGIASGGTLYTQYGADYDEWMEFDHTAVGDIYNLDYYSWTNSSISPSKMYLTFEAMGDGVLGMREGYNYGGTNQMWYRLNGGEWMTSGKVIPVINVTTGDKIEIKGQMETFSYYGGTTSQSYFTATTNFDVYGNALSILDENAIISGFTHTNTNRTISGLFKGMGNHMYSNKSYVDLPSEVLIGGCYSELFLGCTSLTKGPKQIKAYMAYSNSLNAMFSGCTSLNVATNIDIFEITNNSAQNMYAMCTSLTDGPTIKSEIINTGAFSNMFNGCSSLSSVTFIVDDIQDFVFNNTFQGVSNNGTITVTGTSNFNETLKPSGWTLERLSDELYEPFTIEMAEDGDITFTKNSSAPSNTFYYWINSGETGTFNSTKTFSLTAGDKLQIWNSASTPSALGIVSNNDGGSWCFSGTGNHYAYGNIQFLAVAKENAPTCFTSASAGFSRLFKNDTKLISHPTKKLRMPARVVQQDLYRHMFNGCSGLTTKPIEKIQYTGVAPSRLCNDMFAMCSNMVDMPPIYVSGGTASTYWMSGGFNGCTSLTEATIYTKNPGGYCFQGLFNNCTGLKRIECYSNPNNSMTYQWVVGVGSEGTFVKSKGTNWSTGTSGIPSGWTVEEGYL